MSTATQLRVISGRHQGSIIPLTAPLVTIGRAADNSVVLGPEIAASRHHAEFTAGDGDWAVRDLGSLNGTFVNGERIEWPRVLQLGDKIKLAGEVMVFEAAEQPETTTTARQSVSPTVHLDSPASVPMLAEETAAQLRILIPRLEAVVAEMGKSIIGQKEILHSLMLALVSRGHVLMIGLPGLAKTLMIRTLAEVLDLRFRRIQFTPDLMPTDITGTDVLEVDEASGRKSYRFIRGPVFTNILLADEINRTPPKTQAALLEAMQEAHVTAAGETYPLAPPFFVLATQNPLEQEGTYPLPEAQLDRFMFSLRVDYPSEAEEEEIAESTTSDRSVVLSKRMTGEEILLLQRLVRRLPVSPHAVKYATRLARATRPGDPRAPEAVRKWIHCGAGPRATQYLLLAAKAGAVMRGSLVVNCNDIRAAAPAVLRHRMFTNFAADSEGVDVDSIIAKVLKEVQEPGEREYQEERK